MTAAWGRSVDNSSGSWIIPALVDGVDNTDGLSTGRADISPNTDPVIHRFPRSMKERMKK